MSPLGLSGRLEACCRVKARCRRPSGESSTDVIRQIDIVSGVVGKGFLPWWV